MKNQFLVILFSLGFAILMSCNSADSQADATPPTPAPAANSQSDNIQLDRFEKVIQSYEADDKENPIKEGGIVFTGSSSIRLWKSLKEDMKPLPVHNRGFGGSTIPEVIHYADRIVFPYQPEIIVFYCGENDIAAGANPKEVFESYKTFVSTMEEKLPNTKLIFLAMKPSVARWKLWEKYQEGNQMIKAYTDQKDHLFYLAVDKPMLGSEGIVDSTIFVKDMLHMNAKGYERWTKVVRPFLEEQYSTVN